MLTCISNQLCDDEFEEHVLPYPEDQTGLHLHGLNVNEPVLNTLPSVEVASFARAWGMIATSFSVFPSVPAVQTYCERVQADGGVEGPDGKVSPVEGFVVRGHRKGGAPGEAFFWKVKYDEPYLMYREWRELTRKLLAAYPNLETVNPAKIRNDDSRLYLWWVAREIGRDVSAFDSWQHGKGIIKTREAFLSWCTTPEANVARRELGVKVAVSEEERRNRKFDKTLIVPVAIQGCGASLSLSSPRLSYPSRRLVADVTTLALAGKTALGLELSHLFGWGHVQSDDFLQKKPAPHFLRAVKDKLSKHDVVYADKCVPSLCSPSSGSSALADSDLPLDLQEQPHRQAPRGPRPARRLARPAAQGATRRARVADQLDLAPARQVPLAVRRPHRRARAEPPDAARR